MCLGCGLTVGGLIMKLVAHTLKQFNSLCMLFMFLASFVIYSNPNCIDTVMSTIDDFEFVNKQTKNVQGIKY